LLCLSPGKGAGVAACTESRMSSLCGAYLLPQEASNKYTRITPRMEGASPGKGQGDTYIWEAMDSLATKVTFEN
jgi:hypothetical protein